MVRSGWDDQKGEASRACSAGAAAGQHCHAEPIRYAQGKLREASRRLPSEPIRYAQGDKIGTE